MVTETTFALVAGVPLLLVGGMLVLPLIATPAVSNRLIVSLLLFVAFGFALYITVGLFAPDAATYDQQAMGLAKYWRGESATGPEIHAGKSGWPYLLGGLYLFLGASPYVGIAVNAIFCISMAAIAARTSQLLSPNTGRLAFTLALNPTTLFWGTMLLREAGMWFFISLATLGAVGIQKSHRVGAYLTALLIGLLGAYSFRSSVAVALGATLILSLLIARSSRLAVKISLLAVTLAATPTAVAYIQSQALLDPDRIEMSQTELAGANSGFSTGLGSLPATLLRVTLGPFPWEFPSLGLLYLAEWVIWIAILALSIRGTKTRHAWIIWAGSVAVISSLAFTSGNYGTTVRLRAMALVILLPLAAQGWAQIRAKKELRATTNPLHSKTATTHG
ncbi:hypothetical protein [Janibacter indicus]|uniref:hypothetical protein n=1 Tax=Janibacter indicus TaxID=857417 RepID=UPI000B3117E0|nr:hypothetical protein [Janibacter indicus]